MKGKKITAIAMGVGAVFMVAAGAASAASIHEDTEASATATFKINKSSPVSHELKVNSQYLDVSSIKQGVELLTGVVKGDGNKDDVFVVQMQNMDVTDHPYCTNAVPLDDNGNEIKDNNREKLELCFDDVTKAGKVDIDNRAWYKIANVADGVGSYALRTSMTIQASKLTPGTYSVTVNAAKFDK